MTNPDTPRTHPAYPYGRLLATMDHLEMVATGDNPISVRVAGVGSIAAIMAAWKTSGAVWLRKVEQGDRGMASLYQTAVDEIFAALPLSPPEGADLNARYAIAVGAGAGGYGLDRSDRVTTRAIARTVLRCSEPAARQRLKRWRDAGQIATLGRLDTGEQTYSEREVGEAFIASVGQGARTDLARAQTPED